MMLSGCASSITGVSAGQTAQLEARLVRLEAEADRQAVERLIHAYAHGIDTMDEALLRRTFAPDAQAEYRGLNFPMHEDLDGADAIIDWLGKSVGDREAAAPWHFMSTHLIDLEAGADEATLRTFQHNRSMGGIGVYTVYARRTAEGWRISKLRLEERILDETLRKSLNAAAPSQPSQPSQP
jgi:hypothetical protein